MFSVILYLNMLSFGLPADNEPDVFVSESVEEQQKQLREMVINFFQSYFSINYKYFKKNVL